MVVLDATMLLLFLSPNVPAPKDPTTGEPVKWAKQRVDFLIRSLEERRTKIGIPTPALSEALVYAGSAITQYYQIIDRSAVFSIMPFDGRAAIEVALMTGSAISQGDKKSGLTSPWARVKYDRQIVAIAKVQGATEIYSDDGDVRLIAEAVGIPVVGLFECSLPPEIQQGTLPFDEGDASEAQAAP